MNEQLEDLENQLAELPLVQRIGLYLTIIISFIVASWYLFGENLYNEVQTKKNSITSLESKLQKNSMKSLEKMIKSAKKEILVLQEDITNTRYKDKFIQTKLESLGFIIFDEVGIAQILDDILKNSLKNNIDIDVLSSQAINKKGQNRIVEKESINIIGSGSFKNIIALIQYIDSLHALLKIKKISIGLDENKTIFELSISHYGVEL